MIRTLPRCLALIAGAFWILSCGGQVSEEASSEEELLAGAMITLDQFMIAGRDGDASVGAKLLDQYSSSPKKTESEIGEFFEDKETVFSDYVSISKDIYGYELKEKGFKGPNLELEGGIETTYGFTAEFSARLVYRDERWCILSFEID